MDYSKVADYLSQQLATNQSVVSKIKDELVDLKQESQSFLEESAARMVQCRARDLEMSSILTVVRSFSRHVQDFGALAVDGSDGHEGDISGCLAPAAAVDGGGSLDTNAVILSERQMNLTSYLNSRCGLRKQSNYDKDAASSDDDDVAKKPRSKSALRLPKTFRRAEPNTSTPLPKEKRVNAGDESMDDPFDKLLRENETLAREVKAKNILIASLKRKISELERGACQREGGNARLALIEAQKANQRAKKKVRALITKLNMKERENNALSEALNDEKVEETIAEQMRLADENKFLRDSLKSSTAHRSMLESEIHKGYQVLKKCDEEKQRLRIKVEHLETALAQKQTTSNDSGKNPILHKSMSETGLQKQPRATNIWI